MATDYTAAVAGWLAAHAASHHQLAELGGIVAKTVPNREAELEAVRAAALRLDTLGLVVYYHHQPPAVGVQHREGLRRLAAGEPLDVVARDVERTRPVTIVRTESGAWAAWYRSPLCLPVGATVAACGAVIGADPNTARDALREHARALAGLADPSELPCQ